MNDDMLHSPVRLSGFGRINANNNARCSTNREVGRDGDMQTSQICDFARSKQTVKPQQQIQPKIKPQAAATSVTDQALDQRQHM